MTRLGSTQEAKQIYIDILTLTPQNITARERLVGIYQREGDSKSALYHLDRLIKDEFDNPDYLLSKAGLLIALKDNENAKKTLNIVENFIAQDAARLLRLSDQLLLINEEDRALAAMEKAQSAAPDSSMIALAHVRLLLQLDKVNEANVLLASIAPKQQGNANYWLLKGRALAVEERDEQALAAYRRALSLDIDFAPPLIAIYNYALNERYVDVFIEESKAIIKQNPKNLLAKSLLAQYLYFIRDFAAATALYHELVQIPETPSPAQAYNRLAIMAMEMGTEGAESIVRAESYIIKAYELDPSSSKILDTFGWLKAQQGQYETSLKMLRDAFARDANDPNIRYHLGYTLAELGRIEEAKEELTFAVNVNRPFFKRPEAQSLLDSL